MKPAGLMKRIGASILDAIIITIPILGLWILGSEQSRLFQLYWLIPKEAISFWFSVYLVKKYGGTPGKLILGLRIVTVDGHKVGYEEACLRYGVLFIISLFIQISLISVVLNMSDAEYFSLTTGWVARVLYFEGHAPSMYHYLRSVMNIWTWLSFFVVLLNKKRRAPHDFIAGTMVVSKPELETSSSHLAV